MEILKLYTVMSIMKMSLDQLNIKFDCTTKMGIFKYKIKKKKKNDPNLQQKKKADKKLAMPPGYPVS